MQQSNFLMLLSAICIAPHINQKTALLGGIIFVVMALFNVFLEYWVKKNDYK